MRKKKHQLPAWILLVVMICNLFSVGGKEVYAAEEKTYDLLNGSSITEVGTVSKDPYGEDYFCEYQFNDLPSEVLQALGSYDSLKFVAEVTVNETSTTLPTIVGYAMDASYGNWKDVGEELTAVPQTKTIVLDLTDYDTLCRVGIRFTQCVDGTTISYTISSAKLIGISGTDYSGDSENTENEGITSDEVTAKVTQINGNSDWAEFSYRITNGTASAISGIQIKIPYSGNVNNMQSWNCTASRSGGFLIISHTKVIQAGETYSCDADTKFGFAGGASLGSPVVEYVYGESGGGNSGSELKYDLTGETKELAYEETPVGMHGALSLAGVSGYPAPVIVDEKGEPFQLRGASTHGMHWNEMHPYVNKGAFQSLRDEWGINLVRLVSYVTQGGYTQGSQNLLDSKIQEGVAAATELGMYVIIDWHIHAENPWDSKQQAEQFFEKYATMYKDYENVIFEICNEPTGVNWYNNGSGEDLYTYCKDIAKIIRDCGSDALIICGTNTWSQDVDDVAKKPLKDDGFENILYTFHFYSASHYNDKMAKVETALGAGTPIFITEFGVCDASGNGSFDLANADAWIDLCDENNLSFCCWSLCNKNESASYLKPSCTKTTGGWLAEDLATTGIWLVNTCRAHEDAEKGTNSRQGEFSVTVSPEKGILEDLQEGYTTAKKAQLTVENTGNKRLENMSVSLALGSDFQIVKGFEKQTLEAGESASIEIALQIGRESGNYADTVIVQSGSLKKVQNIKQKVVENSIPDTEESTEENTEGSSEESTEGNTEGSSEESTEGNTEGSSEESTEGNTEGSSEESTEGNTEGSSEESTEGNTEGSSEESTEENTEESNEGSTEGNTEGSSEESTGGNTDGSNKENAGGNTGGSTGTNQSEAHKKEDAVNHPEQTDSSKQKATSLEITGDVKNVKAYPIKRVYKLAPKKKLQVNVQLLPKNAEQETLSYHSSKTKVATVTDDGLIIAGNKPGKTKITITSQSGLTKSFTIQVVKKSIKKMKLETSSKTVKRNKKIKLKVLFNQKKKYISTALFWKSANEKIATVSQKGVVKGRRKGIVKITAYAMDGSGKKVSLRIRVK